MFRAEHTLLDRKDVALVGFDFGITALTIQGAVNPLPA
jgi:hypothetical protein